MRRLAGAVSAFAFIAAAACVWSLLVTNAVGLVTPYDNGELPVREQSAAAQVADRFPTAMEMLRPVDFIRQPDRIERDSIAAAAGKGDKLTHIAACGRRDWPFLAPECFVSPTAKLKRPPERTITVERRVGESTSELVRLAVPAAAAAVVPAVAVRVAATIAPPACKQNLAAATARMERALAHAKGVRTTGGTEMCAAYRRDFFELVQAREMTALCKTGTDRERELGSIDVAVENINGAIALSCGS